MGKDLDRERKLELLRRSLGLKHKLKVHDSVRPPETHEEMAVHTCARWELEDEIAAIDELLTQGRRSSVDAKRSLIEREGVPQKKKKK